MVCFDLFGWVGVISRSGGFSREAICVELIVLELEVLCAGVICVLFCLVAFGSVVMLICFVFSAGHCFVLEIFGCFGVL